MTRTRHIAILTPILLLMLHACSVETDSTAGGMGGYWRLMSICRVTDTSTSNTDSTEQAVTIDLSDSRLFWALRGTLLEMSDADGNLHDIICRTSYSNDTVHISNPCYISKENNDPPVNSLDTLMLYGFSSMEPSYHVQTTSSRMTLTNDTVTLQFKKY